MSQLPVITSQVVTIMVDQLKGVRFLALVSVLLLLMRLYKWFELLRQRVFFVNITTAVQVCSNSNRNNIADADDKYFQSSFRKGTFCTKMKRNGVW